MERLMAIFSMKTLTAPEKRRLRGIGVMGALSILALYFFAL